MAPLTGSGWSSVSPLAWKPPPRHEQADEFVKILDLDEFDAALARIERLGLMIDRTIKRLMQLKTMKQMHGQMTQMKQMHEQMGQMKQMHEQMSGMMQQHRAEMQKLCPGAAAPDPTKKGG